MSVFQERRVVVSLFAFLLIINSCTTVPLTNRKQVNLLQESEMVAMSLTSYTEFLKSHKVSSNAQQTEMVKRVGKKISDAVTAFLKKKGKEHLVKDYKWEYNLVEDSAPNAWCMPGGKVVVYTGILPFTKTETGLAVVMGHEIAHAIARHGNERMSQSLIVQYGGLALDLALNEKPQETRDLFMQAYGIGTQMGMILPYSRLHETEADKLGLIFMAMAGYDPHEATKFWERMSKAGGQKPPEMLSTHPADETRIKNLNEFLPEALKYYKKEN